MRSGSARATSKPSSPSSIGFRGAGPAQPGGVADRLPRWSSVRSRGPPDGACGRERRKRQPARGTEKAAVAHRRCQREAPSGRREGRGTRRVAGVGRRGLGRGFGAVRIDGRLLGDAAAKEAGIKPGSRLGLVGAPDDFAETLGELPDGVRVARAARDKDQFDVIVCFARSSKELARELPALPARLHPGGGLWIAWPKKSAKKIGRPHHRPRRSGGPRARTRHRPGRQ